MNVFYAICTGAFIFIGLDGSVVGVGTSATRDPSGVP